MIKERKSGLLLHLTSLPAGGLGPGAIAFLAFLKKAKQHYWQILPLNPTDPAFGNSPYSSYSAFAGNTSLISPELSTTKVAKKEFETFCRQNADWLDDFALFCAIKKMAGNRSWVEWSRELKDREPSALKSVQAKHGEAIEQIKLSQYLFYQQWHELLKQAHARGIKIIGDLPIYVSFDSVDVWANRKLFKLDLVAGVPPDYFSQTGQRWGNPVYDWEKMKQDGYKWWLRRIEHNLALFDLIRIDHFRGFESFWQIPIEEKTAVNGRWAKGPADDLFIAFKKKFRDLPIIAEDLGIITDKVRDLAAKFGFPGMKILLFAFGEDNPLHPYLPKNYPANSVAYTGTHDNNTVRGWFETEAGADEKRRLFNLLGRQVTADEVSWALVEQVSSSPANTVIFPLQDILGLGADARMNLPARTEGNWNWRLNPDSLKPQLAERLAELTKTSVRN